MREVGCISNGVNLPSALPLMGGEFRLSVLDIRASVRDVRSGIPGRGDVIISSVRIANVAQLIHSFQ